MTVTSLGVRNEYTATASQKIFNFTFLIFGTSDLNVYITPSGQDANDSTDITTAYTITSGVGDPNGGAISLNSGTNSGDLVTIVSSITNDRTVDYQSSGDFDEATVNGDFDKQLSLVKQQRDSTSRTLSFEQSLQNASSLSLPTPVAGQYMVWKADLTGLETTGAPGSILNDDLTGTTTQMVANASLVAGDIIMTTGYGTTGDGGDNMFLARAVTGATADGGSLIKGVGNAAIEFVGLFPKGVHNAKQWGAIADGSTDNSTTIESALAYVRANKGKLLFTANNDSSPPSVYSHATSLELGASDVTIEGESPAVHLKYTGVGTGLSVNTSTGDTHRERCGLKSISLVSSTGAIAFDFTSGSYGNYEDVEIAYTAANAQLIYATGHSGAGPYSNKFNGFTLFGSSGRTQIGVRFKADGSGNLADGPNANHFTNLKRGASLATLIDIQSGIGNLFTGIHGESISDALIILNNVPSFADSGTSTSTTSSGLVDTSKTWSTVLGNPLNFTNGTVKLTSGITGETRRITSNTVDTLVLDRPWSQNPGATVTYQISQGKAVNNKFVNVRQEGLDSDNPDGIRLMPGAKDNEFNNMEFGSLGSGVALDAQSQEQSNKVRQGDLIVLQYVVLNPGPSTTVEVIPRSGVFGGIRSGSNMSLEYVEMLSPNFTTGSSTATLTIDHGGASTGAGTETLTAIVDDFNSKQCLVVGSKVMRGTLNTGIYASLTTNANVGAGDDFIINIGIQVK